MTFTDRKGQLTQYAYDSLDRLTQIHYNDQSTTSFTCDAGNRVTPIVDTVSGTITRTYDNLDRLKTETTPQGSISYTYDAASRRTSMTVTGQPTVNYTYDIANKLTQITQGSSMVIFAYDSANRFSSVTLPNGIVRSYSYDGASRVTSISYSLGSASLGNLVYTYDAVGRRTSVGGSLATTSLPAALNSATYNLNNQLVQWGAATLSYDFNGNMTSDGTNSFSWDDRNRLFSMNSAGFAYDAMARRTQNAAGTGFFYDGANVVQELSGSTVTANLLTGMGADQVFTRTDASGSRTFLTDALGSTIALTDASGTTQTQYTYGPFGVTTLSGSASSNSIQYTGRENDGTGLYYYRARYYNSSLHRFISEDPVGMSGSGTNLYGYAGNDPTNAGDPSGLWSPKAHDAFIQHALASCGVSQSDIKAIESASRWFDVETGTSEYWSFAHSMRAPGQSSADAAAKRNQFIEDSLNTARGWYASGNTPSALSDFGIGIHTIMDMTSPAHTDAHGDPIVWCFPNGCGDNKGKHSSDLPLLPRGTETKDDITERDYQIEDQAIRDAFSYMTGKKLTCRYSQ